MLKSRVFVLVPNKMVREKRQTHKLSHKFGINILFFPTLTISRCQCVIRFPYRYFLHASIVIDIPLLKLCSDSQPLQFENHKREYHKYHQIT